MTPALLVLLAAAGAAAPPAAPPARGAAVDQEAQLSEADYRRGLEQLRGYLEKRGESPEFVDRFVDDLEKSFRGPEDQLVPVTRGTFAAFLKYESAWARKTRDAKNDQVQPQQLRHEQQRAQLLHDAFKADAERDSPTFYRAFRSAVRDVRKRSARGPKAYTGSSGVFFGDDVDDAYSHVDAADEALDNGDATGAIAEANKAIAESPGNADAYAMRAGAEYDQQDYAAAVRDAQTALRLDPGNQTARAITTLSASAADPAAAGARALADARAIGTSLRGAAAGSAASSPAAVLAPAAPPARALGVRLANDLTLQAARGAGLDAQASISRLDQAISLDPQNGLALDWRATLGNRAKDYFAARGAADRALALNPRDAFAHYNRAYSFAGAHDRAGMLDSLRQAAAVEPAYRAALEQALKTSDSDDFTLLFANGLMPAQPRPHRRSRGWPTPSPMLLGAMGALLLGLVGMHQLLGDKYQA